MLQRACAIHTLDAAPLARGTLGRVIEEEDTPLIFTVVQSVVLFRPSSSLAACRCWKGRSRRACASWDRRSWACAPPPRPVNWAGSLWLEDGTPGGGVWRM